MSQCIVCSQQTVEERPVVGSSVSAAQLYCAQHLKEHQDSGDFGPITAPVPEK